MINYVKKIIKFLTRPKITFYAKAHFVTVTNLPTETKKEFTDIAKKVIPVKSGVSSHVSLKRCPGIVDYATLGYVIRAWTDILITTDSDGESFNWKANLDHTYHNINRLDPAVTHFDSNLYYDYFPRKNTFRSTLKINTPWHVEVPKGYNLLFAPVWYDNEERFTTIPGILDPEINDNIKILLYWHSIGKTEIIKAGTPLARIIPIKMDNWKVNIKEASDEFIKESEAKVIKHYKGPPGRF